MSRITSLLRSYYRGTNPIPFLIAIAVGFIVATVGLIFKDGIRIRTEEKSICCSVKPVTNTKVEDTLFARMEREKHAEVMAINPNAIPEFDGPWIRHPIDSQLQTDPFNGCLSSGSYETEAELNRILKGFSYEFVLDNNEWWHTKRTTIIGKMNQAGPMKNPLAINSSFSLGTHLNQKHQWYLVGRDGLQRYDEQSKKLTKLQLPESISMGEWVYGITYDTKRNRLALLAPDRKDNRSRLFAYDLSKKEWSEFCSLPNQNSHVKGLFYSAKDDSYYCLARAFNGDDRGQHTYIYKINPTGKVEKSIPLSTNLCGSEQWYKANLHLSQHKELLVVAMLGDAFDPLPPRFYLFNDKDGELKHMNALGF